MQYTLNRDLNVRYRILPLCLQIKDKGSCSPAGLVLFVTKLKHSAGSHDITPIAVALFVSKTFDVFVLSILCFQFLKLCKSTLPKNISVDWNCTCLSREFLISQTHVTFVPILWNAASTEIYNSGEIVIGTCNKWMADLRSSERLKKGTRKEKKKIQRRRRRTSTVSETFSILIYPEAIKFVLLGVICLKIWANICVQYGRRKWTKKPGPNCSKLG